LTRYYDIELTGKEEHVLRGSLEREPASYRQRHWRHGFMGRIEE